MDIAVIRNNNQRDELIATLKERRLPFKVAIQDIYPVRSLEFNNYYWGVVLKTISDYSGHAPEEIHEAYKRLFNLKQEFEFNAQTKMWEIVTAVGSTAELDQKEFAAYVSKVRADAEVDMGISIPLPNEVFINELIFEAEL